MSHLFDSLQSAARMVVQQGNAISRINVDRWAETYRCSPAEVEEALKIAQNGARKLPEEVAAGAPPIPESKEEEE